MSQYTLTVVDTIGIQDYIFGTNNLQQNVGASYLVDCATQKWVVEALPTPHNVIIPNGKGIEIFTEQKIEDGLLKSEVVYMGGGNTLIIFTDHSLALDFTHRLTRRVLLEAPGLQVVLAHENFDWHHDQLGGKGGIVQKVMNKLAIRKADRITSSPILGLGVTASCAFTGLPAVGQDSEDRLISAEVEAKIKAESDAHTRLKELIDFRNYDLPKDFDDFGRTRGESSYIAVIHTDGNGMGKRIQWIRDQFSTPDKNREYVLDMRSFSESVQRAALKALQQTVNRLSASVRDGKIGDIIKLQDNKLPFRPIVFGGDDVTFVCDGRLGLNLTAYYLEQFSDNVLTDNKPAYCRAGVAVVKTHYPFARAYALAAELCDSAKQYIKQRKQPPYNEDDLTAMDWHFVRSGLVRGLKDIREQEYTVEAGRLFMRPIRLTDPEKDWSSWTTFRQIVREFQNGEQWAERRNKIKALRDALRRGPEAVKHFCSVYNLGQLPSIVEQPEMAGQGWQGGRCGYFDAIEAMDFFVPLEGGEEP